MSSLIVEPVRKQIIKRRNALQTERSKGWDSHYSTLAAHLSPRAGRMQTTERNKGGESAFNNIIDSTGTRALRVLAAGMMAGMTNPARPWFVLRTPDADLNKSNAVRQWLQAVTDLMLRVFRKSNTYNALHAIYRELGVFGTACNFISPDFGGVIHNYTATAGEYILALDNRMSVDTVFRQFELTLNQASQWGFNISEQQRRDVDTGNGDKPMTVIHAVEPRSNRDITKRDNLNMPWRSIYIDVAGDEDRILQEGGFRMFPAVCPRWDVTGNDTYGTSPGMEALGDVKQLQQEQYRKAEAIDYKARPPLQVPTTLKDRDADFLPGGVSYYDGAAANAGIRTAFEVDLDINDLMIDIQDVRQRINSAFYADIFLMLANSDNSAMTATEVAERHEEKLLMLGPVLERLHSELLNPLIENCFTRLLEADLLPPPPEEMQGMDLQVEFVSMLAQAQRAVAVNGVDRYIANLGSIAALKPNILDRFSEDGWVEHYSDILGVDASLVVPMEQAMFIREQRAQQQQAQAQAEQANVNADTAAKTAQAAATAGVDLPSGAGYAIGAPVPAQGASLPSPLAPGAGF